MKTKVVYPELIIHTTPLERVEYHAVEEYTYIYLDDVNEKRWRLKVYVNVAIKIVAFDCTSWNDLRDSPSECFENGDRSFDSKFERHILEVIDSEWIKELTETTLKTIDPALDSLENARHFILPLYDTVIEFVAWDIILEEADKA